jgi:hypothetical protein
MRCARSARFPGEHAARGPIEQVQFVTLRSDHVAGCAFIALGVLVFAISGDLPFGTVSAPGAGMMPKLMAGLMIGFAALVIAGGSDSQEFSTIDWSDRWHAALLVVVERRNLLPAAAYSIALTLFAYWLFGKALKSPLERGILWF